MENFAVVDVAGFSPHPFQDEDEPTFVRRVIGFIQTNHTQIVALNPPHLFIYRLPAERVTAGKKMGFGVCTRGKFATILWRGKFFCSRIKRRFGGRDWLFLLSFCHGSCRCDSVKLLAFFVMAVFVKVFFPIPIVPFLVIPMRSPELLSFSQSTHPRNSA